MVLEPDVVRYRNRDFRRYFRADAAFAKPEIYEFLEAERTSTPFGYRPTRSSRKASRIC